MSEYDGNYIKLKEDYDFAIKSAKYYRGRVKAEKNRKTIGVLWKELVYWNTRSAILERLLLGDCDCN